MMADRLVPLTRTDLEEWWERVPGARRFLKTVGREAEQNRALALDLSATDADGFLIVLKEEIQRRNYSLVLERLTLSAGLTADGFVTALAERFEPHYLPDLLSGSMMTDVARKKILSGYVAIVTIEERAGWLADVINDFNRVEDSGKGTVIFLTSELPSPITLRLTDFITPYDVQFFAINQMESVRLSQAEKLYTATLTAKLSGTSAVLAKNLACAELYTDGQRLVQSMMGADFRQRDYERAVWETQIQFALPIIEAVREELIARNLDGLKRLLPVTDEFGKSLNEPLDMELRHLHYYGGNDKVFSVTDWELLELVYRARNDLSHLDLIDADRLDKIFALAPF